MDAPKPFFGANTPKRRPLPVVRGASKGAPPSPSPETRVEEKPDLGPEYGGNHPRLVWLKLNDKCLPSDTDAPIVVYMPDVGFEYSVVKASTIRSDYLLRKKKVTGLEAERIVYKRVTHWAYLPLVGEVPF